MASKAPGVIRHGTARDLADHGVGYTASGESEYSRHSANAKNQTQMERRHEHGRAPRASKNVHELLARANYELRKLKIEISLESSRERLTKLQKDLAIKTAFIARLEKEIADEGKSK